MLLVRLIEPIPRKSFAVNIEEGIARPLALRSTYAAQDIDQGCVISSHCRNLNVGAVIKDIYRRYHTSGCLTNLIVSTGRRGKILFSRWKR
jgi:hypothetical protein